MADRLRAPFPWFGGKSMVADAVWERFGDVASFVEPFFGSGAVLLGRPDGAHGVETVNDLDGFVSNFWRSCAHSPTETWVWADSPVNEVDLHARHVWLIGHLDGGFTERLMSDPDWHDPKVAGWWVWGLCAWIGQGWCTNLRRHLPHLGTPGAGVNSYSVTAGTFAVLSARMRRTRVTCGDWERVLGKPVVTPNGVLGGVFLDPPYASDSGHSIEYRGQTGDIADGVREWALGNGDNPLLRIALCGYASEGADVLAEAGWTVHPWKAKGGYGSMGDSGGRVNSARETIWFSPHCLDPANRQPALFDA